MVAGERLPGEHADIRTLTAVLVYLTVCLFAVAYAAFFSWLSIQRYDALLMHALDMGNMDQAIWHTLHGDPFYFTNMRVSLPKEAYGTTTRLSFHVEPILLPLSLLYLIHSGPETLIVAQALIVSLGAPVAARLAMRLTGSAALALAAAGAYLLSPTLQAATLYEFHPVTLVASLLMWAIVFAEERGHLGFVVCSALAIACKEEIGLVVAMLCLWLWWRGGSGRVALALGMAAVCWSIVAIEAIVPHFAHGSSAYWQRYIDAGSANARTSSGAGGLLTYWLHHPDRPILTLLWAPKWAMMHRLLVQMGYLGLLGAPALLIGAPSLAIILLSTDQHMYGGLGHYSAELVPLGTAAAIYGVAWAARLAARRHLPSRALVTVCAAWLALAALSNARVNGFTPIAGGYAPPAITARVALGHRLLALIPPAASVSATDQLDPLLGDRQRTFLFPDVGDSRIGFADYVALDLTTNATPGTADDLDQRTPFADQHRVALGLLASRRYRILAAQDGFLILQRSARPLARVPSLPSSLFTYLLGGSASGRPIARIGNALELVGVAVARREQVNLRVPDAVVTTSWRVLRPLSARLRFHVQVIDTRGDLKNDFADTGALDWLPANAWPVGSIVRLQSPQISFVTVDPGSMSLRVRFEVAGRSGQDPAFAPRLLGDEQAPDIAVDGNALQVAQVRIVF